MKPLNYIFIIILVISIIGAGALFFTKYRNEQSVACTMDAMICPDGSSVGRTGPNCSFAPCPTASAENTPSIPADIAAHIASKADLIVLDAPKPYERISSPVTLNGKARGSWFFEASFPIEVVDWDGKIIGTGHATAQGDWMTSEFVPFVATIAFKETPGASNKNGSIILRKDNPSGLPENDNALEIPVIFK